MRDILSEHQLYYHSTKRLFYKRETKLITQQALEALRSNKERMMSLAKAKGQIQAGVDTSAGGSSQDPNAAASAKVPSVTYLIEEMVMFRFQDNYLLLIAFENKSVQLFECKNGHFIHEFHFYDNILTQLQQQNKQLLLQKQEKQKATQLNKDAEMNPQRQEQEAALRKAQEAQRRRQLKEKGIFQCPAPKPRDVVKSYHLDSAS